MTDMTEDQAAENEANKRDANVALFLVDDIWMACRTQGQEDRVARLLSGKAAVIGECGGIDDSSGKAVSLSLAHSNRFEAGCTYVIVISKRARE